MQNSNSNIKVLGISGLARSGKDTFVGIAKNILTKNGYTPIRIAFADELKKEAQAMLKANKFSASVYTEDSEAKKLIRPLLVWWGCQRRYESEGGAHWVNTADSLMKSDIKVLTDKGIPSENLVFLVSDVRFENEAKWIQNSWGGVVIHLKRWTAKWGKEHWNDSGPDTLTKVFDPAPNEEEAKNDPLVQKLANHQIDWESKKILTSSEAIADGYLHSVVLEALNQTKYFKHTSSGILSY